MKILQWDTNGFCHHYTRLESGKFKWPMHPGDMVAM
ncbi:IS66 family insertion sequence element accessory protein TnpB [Photobacterium atrarenae]